MARPTKVEGNPDHLSSLRGERTLSKCPGLPSSVFDPPTVLKPEVYDGRIGSWAAFQDYLSTAHWERKKAVAGRACVCSLPRLLLHRLAERIW